MNGGRLANNAQQPKFSSSSPPAAFGLHLWPGLPSGVVGGKVREADE